MARSRVLEGELQDSSGTESIELDPASASVVFVLGVSVCAADAVHVALAKVGLTGEVTEVDSIRENEVTPVSFDGVCVDPGDTSVVALPVADGTEGLEVLVNTGDAVPEIETSEEGSKLDERVITLSDRSGLEIAVVFRNGAEVAALPDGAGSWPGVVESHTTSAVVFAC